MSLPCGICSNKYDRKQYQPCTLVCGHTLCIQCAGRLQRCPICQKVSGDKNDRKPNYEMMDLMDKVEELKLQSINMMKKQSPELLNNMKNGYKMIGKLNQNLRERILEMDKDMKDQKKIVEKNYREYLKSWKKNHELLMQSKQKEEKIISDLDLECKNILSNDRLMTIYDNGLPKIDDFIRESTAQYEEFQSKLLKANATYENILVKPPVNVGQVVTIQIYKPTDANEAVQPSPVQLPLGGYHSNISNI